MILEWVLNPMISVTRRWKGDGIERRREEGHSETEEEDGGGVQPKPRNLCHQEPGEAGWTLL
jgi:hypothetical protein